MQTKHRELKKEIHRGKEEEIETGTQDHRKIVREEASKGERAEEDFFNYLYLCSNSYIFENL